MDPLEVARSQVVYRDTKTQTIAKGMDPLEVAWSQVVYRDTKTQTIAKGTDPLEVARSQVVYRDTKTTYALRMHAFNWLQIDGNRKQSKGDRRQ